MIATASHPVVSFRLTLPCIFLSSFWLFGFRMQRLVQVGDETNYEFLGLCLLAISGMT
jgi:hypothetical protein